MNGLIEQGKKTDVEYNEEQYKQSENYMRTVLKALIARDIYENGSYYRIANDLSTPIYHEGLKVINSPDEYKKLLGD